MATVKECKEMIRSVTTGAANTPLTIMLWGSPGIGKTSLVHQVAKDLGVGFKSVVAHLYQPVDVLGLPYINEGKCEYAPPSVFPDAERDGEHGIFFIDELPNCVPAMQSAWGIVVLERSTKHYKFPPGWVIVCAGNRETDRAGASRLISALENRLLHINVEANTEEFLNYSVARGLHPSIPAFLQERPDMLVKFDTKGADRAFPSPRSWERASEIMQLSLTETSKTEMLKGAIGSGSAVEFQAFSRVFGELPKLADVLSGKVDLSAIKRPDIMRAIIYSVLSYAGQTKEPARISAVATVATQLPDEWAMLLTLRLWELVPGQLRETPAWKGLQTKFHKYLLGT